MSDHTTDLLEGLDLPGRDLGDLPTSSKRFADGGQWRLEMPSVEGPAAMARTMEAADRRGVPVHRVSQGSGIMMLTDAELDEMIEQGRTRGVEVCLFVGPRAGWDVGVQATTRAGSAMAGSLRGADQLRFGLADVVRGCEHGLRSVLVADVGLLSVIGRLRASGDLPADLVVKVSVSLPVANPATAAVFEDLGASTLNLPPDLTLAQIAAIRAAVDAPIDMYVEAPDDVGGTVRHYEVPELVRVGAPIHLKFTVRNSPGVYPSGLHLEPTVLALCEERVRRAEIGLAMLGRFAPDAQMSPRHTAATA